MLTVSDITVRYGDLVALDDVSLEVGPEETLAVLGASGSGKTTLLRVVAGITRPDAGIVTWEGTDLAGTPAHRRRFGLVFQDFALFPHLSVAANVAFGLRMSGTDPASIPAAVDAALARMGLAGYGERPVEGLSGGEAQRVALARTLAPVPRLLLLDEPLGSLDPALRRGLATDLRSAISDAGRPALLVTHDTEEAFALADRVAVLDRGRLVRIGTPAEVWEAPGRAVVAGLLGHAVVPGPFAGIAARPGRSLAIRADAVRLDPAGDHRVVVAGSVFRGPDWVHTVTLDGATIEVASAAHQSPGAELVARVDRGGVVEVEA